MQNKQTTAAPGGGDSSAAIHEANKLREEAHFWRELIGSVDENGHSSETVERMRQALALAEYRLAIGSQGGCH